MTGRLRAVAIYRGLLWMLVWRDLRVRYKHAALGAAWAVVPPLLTMAVFAVVFRQALGLEDDALTGQVSAPYPVFALTGVLAWNYFASSLTGAVTSLVANRPLLTKIQFPREVFPFAAVGGALIDLFVAGAAFAGIVAWYHFTTGWRFHFHWTLLFVPVVLLVQSMLTAGLALLSAMGNLFYRDVGFILRSILPLWMFVTNVVYDLRTAGPRWGSVLSLNPLTPIISAYRDCLFAGRLPQWGMFSYAAGVSLLLLAGAWAWFHVRQAEFAENV
ncbi:MAG: ABC transporter permease [Phycisphaerae bacterium]